MPQVEWHWKWEIPEEHAVKNEWMDEWAATVTDETYLSQLQKYAELCLSFECNSRSSHVQVCIKIHDWDSMRVLNKSSMFEAIWTLISIASWCGSSLESDTCAYIINCVLIKLRCHEQFDQFNQFKVSLLVCFNVNHCTSFLYVNIIELLFHISNWNHEYSGSINIEHVPD